MPGRFLLRCLLLAVVVVMGCTTPPGLLQPADRGATGDGAAPSTPARLAIPGDGFSLSAPAGSVDVTERALRDVVATPLFATPGMTVLGIYVSPTEPGSLDHALVAGELADGRDPESAARALADRAGRSGAVHPVEVAGQTWYVFEAAVGTGADAPTGQGALCHFYGHNVLLVEGPVKAGQSALWSVAESLTRG